jgi:two-component system chemotaxis response regulator CheY
LADRNSVPADRNNVSVGRISVLIADDHTIVRSGVRLLLNAEAEFQVVGEARDGLEAVKLAEELHPDVVLMDISMPEIDGLAALRVIREQDPHARVVMLSALGQESAVVEAITAGASDFLIKPFERERVLNVISTLLY